MGAFSSKTSDFHKKSSHVRSNKYGYDGLGHQPYELESTEKQCQLSTLKAIESTVEKADLCSQVKKSVSNHESMTGRAGKNDDFYDGIPRYSRDLSQSFRSMRTKQGSEVSSRLGRAGTLGLEKAVEVLDILGSSMTNLNPKSGFISGVTIKGNELSILAFEVANTIVKGYGLMQSMSNRRIEQLKEVVLSSEGVQKLVSRDIDELLKMVAIDKREELKTFSAEVIRFGNRCKNPQWHNLDRYFERWSKEPHKQFKEEAEIVMLQFMTLVHHTAELYQELNTLDRLEKNNQHKNQKENNSKDTHCGEDLATVRIRLKRQKKKVKALKKKSLWSKSMEESPTNSVKQVMEKLVEVVLFLNREINNAFGSTNADTESSGSLSIGKRLGPVGLSLHYANIVQQIDSIVSRSSSVPSIAREILYHNLPPHIKSSLRSKLQTFHVNKEFTVTDIKVEMEKTFSWLAPIVANTSKAHHGFGWVGEWASTRSDTNLNQGGMLEITRIETLHHADKGKTEDCILELVLWLNLMTKQTNAIAQSSMALPTNQVLNTRRLRITTC